MLRPINPFNRYDTEKAREELERYIEKQQERIARKEDEEFEDEMHVEPRDRLD